MSDNIIDIIINAIDQASDVFNDVSSNASGSMEEVSSTAEGASASIDTVTESASSVNDNLDSVDASSLDDVASNADNASSSLDNIDGSSLDDVANSAGGASEGLDKVSDSAGSSLDALVQLQSVQILSDFGTQAEDAAQGINEVGISVGQLATNTGIAEPQVKEMLNHITNATFPHDEAIKYTNLLNQMGVTGSDALGKSATAMDIINDATGIGADNVMKLSSSFNVMGVDMTNIEGSYNAVAYAQDNVIGGVEAYVGWMTKYDAEFANMGLNIDQSAVLIAAATQKFGGGRAAYTGLNDAIKETNGDLGELEKSLGMQPGALANAEQATGQYAGKVDELAAQEAEHKTWLDQVGAAYDDFTLSVGDTMAPINNLLGSFGGIMSIMPGIVSVQMLYNSLKGSEATADNVSFLSKVKNTGSTIAETVAKGANAVATGAVTAATWLWNAALSANPIGIVVIAIVALIAILWHLYNTNEDVRKAIDAIWSALQELGNIIMSILKPALDWLMGALGNLTEFFSALFSGDFGKAGKMIEDFFNSIWNSISNIDWNGILSTILDGIKELPHMIIDGVKQVLSGGIDIVAMIISFIWGDQAGANFKNKATFFLENIMGQLHELVDSIVEGVKGIFGTVLDIGSMIIDFLFNFQNFSPQARMNELLNILYMALVVLPQEIIGLVHNVFSAGIDIVTEIIRFIFGDDVANQFNEKAQNILQTLTDFFMELPKQIFDIVASAFNVAFDFVQMIVAFIFGDSANGNFDQASQTFLESITSFFTDLPVKLEEIIVGALGAGIDILSFIVGAIFGDETGEAFLDRALTVLDNLFNIDWWIENFTSGITNIANILFEIHPIKLIIDAIFGEGTTADLLTAITEFLSGLGELPGKIWNFLVSIITSIAIWILDLGKKAREAGLSFINNIIKHIKELPGQLWENFLKGLGKIAEFASQGLSKAKKVGDSIVKGVIDYVKNLPQKVWEELMRVGDKIMEAGGDLFNKAKDMGKNILDGALGALGIKSPGKLYYAILDETKRVINRIKDTAKEGYDAAKELGGNITDGFGSPDLNINTDVANTDVSSAESSANVTTDEITQESIDSVSVPISDESIAKLQENSEFTITTVEDTTESIMTSFEDMSENIDKNLTDMVKTDKNSWTKIKNNTVSSLKNISSNAASQWSKVNQNTKSTLSSITSSTKSSANQMSSAWNGMKNDIVKAADNIRSQSKTHFDNVSSNIKDFYGKLQNPSRWGAGPINHSSPSRSSFGAGGLSNLLNKVMPVREQTISFSQAESNSCIDSGCAEFKGLTGQNINIKDLLDDECINCDVGGAGWLDSVSPNVAKIKETSSNWAMKAPKIMNKYATPLAFKVKDFLTSTPKIDFSTFKQIASALFNPGAITYDYYFNSEKYGSWQRAIQSGAVNCSDGSDALIALAHTFGLPASKVHGTWNGIGHFWANVAGHKMDTTGASLGKGWTPKESGSGPSIQYNGSTNQAELTINIKNEDYKVTVDLANVPPNMDEKELKEIIKESLIEKDISKNIVKQVIDELKKLLNQRKAATGGIVL